MSWIATAVVGGAVIGAIASSSSADSAADAQESASASSIGEQRRQFDLVRSDTAPYREAGESALERLNALSEGDMSSFYKSPGYNFNLDENQKAIDRSLSSRGRALSGAGVKEGMRYASGLASNEFGNYWNRQSGLAGTGQTAVGTSGQAGMNAAKQIGNYNSQAGTARGNAYLTAGQGINNAAQTGIGNYLYYQNYMNPQSSPASNNSLYTDNQGFVYNL